MTYEVYALKYAHHARRASENFIGGDPHDGPMPLDYFVWLIRGNGREIVVDTGFSAAMAAKRGRNHLRCPTEGLRLLGTDSKTVRDVVITHLHYDHVGNFDLFPEATLHLQDLEMRYVTGRYRPMSAFAAPTRSRMWWAWCAGCTRTACASTTATPKSRRASRCI